MPTRCNRGFYCRSYCLLNMFRASLCPSSAAQEYYTVVAACGISCCGFSSRWSGVELRVMRPVCRCLASNKICNKNLCCVQLTFYFHIQKKKFKVYCDFSCLNVHIAGFCVEKLQGKNTINISVAADFNLILDVPMCYNNRKTKIISTSNTSMFIVDRSSQHVSNLKGSSSDLIKDAVF